MTSNRGFATTLRSELTSRSNSFGELTEPHNQGNTPDKVTQMLASKSGTNFAKTRADIDDIFNEWGPASDVMDYNLMNILPDFGESGIKGTTSSAHGSIKNRLMEPASTKYELNSGEIQARDDRLMSLTTEAGWVSYMKWFFLWQLAIKKEEGEYPPELYIYLENIITDIFNLYARKSEYLKFSDDTADQATFLEFIQGEIRERIGRYYRLFPEGRNMEKRVDALGDALLGYIAFRKPITKGQLEKYGAYIGKKSGFNLSAFELQILRTIKEIEQIIASEGEFSKRYASTTKSPEDTYRFLKRNILKLQSNEGDLYLIATMLYDLGKSIQLAAQPYKKVTHKKPSLVSSVRDRFQKTFAKK